MLKKNRYKNGGENLRCREKPRRRLGSEMARLRGRVIKSGKGGITI